VLGTAPYATISITVQSKTLQETYLLTASPQISQPNSTTRVIPDRPVYATASASRTTATSGTTSIPGTQANGSVLFDNSGQSTFSVPQETIFTTTSGIEVKVTQSVEVPPRSGGQDGTVTTPAVAVFAGITGNITTNAINTICCGGQVTVSNPEPFSGGVDPRIAHFVTQADLDGVKNALLGQLNRQALQQLRKELAANEVEAAPPSYDTKVFSDSAPGTKVDEVRVQVSVSARAFAYNLATVRQFAAQLLYKQATILLDGNYQLKGAPTIATPKVVQEGVDGIIYLSVPARGLWMYTFSSQQIGQWQQAVKGATPTLAETYLVSQSGVAGVQIQLPFGADHLPIAVDQIKIVLVNV
jgi:hypothetical protein